jgi:hypothetical protein
MAQMAIDRQRAKLVRNSVRELPMVLLAQSRRARGLL